MRSLASTKFDETVEGLDDDGRRRAVAALHDSLAAHESADGVFYDSAAWMITASRAP